MNKVIFCLVFALLFGPLQTSSVKTTDMPPQSQSTDAVYAPITSQLSNHSSDVDGSSDEDEKSQKIPLVGIICIIIIAVGLVANGIVFFVIIAGKRSNNTVTVLYVLQLAIADSIFLISLSILTSQLFDGRWILGDAACALFHTIKSVNYYAGMYFLTAMSVDRYIAVAYSTKSHQLRTRTRTLVVCAIVWFIALFMSTPAMFFARTEEFESVTTCKMMFPGYESYDNTNSSVFENYAGNFDDTDDADYYDDDTDYYDNSYENENTTDDFDGTIICKHETDNVLHSAWMIVTFAAGFLVPILIISVSYILILKQLSASEERVANLTIKKNASTRKRVTRMVAALVICFAVCWLPINILHLLKIPGITVTRTACNTMAEVFTALAFSNSAINPILYSFLGHSFRSRLIDSINSTKRRWTRTKNVPLSGSKRRAGTQSNSDQSSAKKKLTNMIRNHKVGQSGSSSKENDRCGSATGLSPEGGKFQMGAVTWLELQKKVEDWTSDNQTEDPNYTTRTNGMPTEVTRVLQTDKETSGLVDNKIVV